MYVNSQYCDHVSSVTAEEVVHTAVSSSYGNLAACLTLSNSIASGCSETHHEVLSRRSIPMDWMDAGATRDQFLGVISRDVIWAIADYVFEGSEITGVPVIDVRPGRGGTIDEWIADAAASLPSAPRASCWRIAVARREPNGEFDWFAVAPNGISVGLESVDSVLDVGDSSYTIRSVARFSYIVDARLVRRVRLHAIL